MKMNKAVGAACLLASAIGCSAATGGSESVDQADEAFKASCGDSGTRFYVPPADDGAPTRSKI